MMDELLDAASAAAAAVASGDVTAVARFMSGGQQGAAEVLAAAADYPGELRPYDPGEITALADVIPIDGEVGAFRLEVPLCTAEEGPSDLWLLLDCQWDGENAQAEIYSCLVM